jgi:hypothetical protein
VEGELGVGVHEDWQQVEYWLAAQRAGAIAGYLEK